jgi:hypothetical protein
VTQPSTEDQIAGLREEIRQAGARVGRIQAVAAFLLGLPVALLVLTLFYLGSRFYDKPIDAAAWQVAAVPTGSVGVAVLFAWPLSAAIAQARRVDWCYEFLDRLAELLPAAQAEVLVPLLKDSDDCTRKLAVPLFRELGYPTEISPAPAPAGRGDEPASADWRARLPQDAGPASGEL